MKTKKRIIPALVFSLFAAFGSAESGAAQFSNVYVFGDSLSDAGYFRGFLASLGLPPSLVATLGRFTINPGPVWSELVAAHYGVTNPRPSNAGGTIFAQGGARVALPSASTPPGAAQRPVSTQIDEFLAAGGGAADPNALYAVWGGGNDILQNIGLLQAGAITSAQFQTNVLAAATAEVGQIARLQAAGARYILVFALPDVGATPSVQAAGAATAASITAISAGFNTTLFTGLAAAGVRAIPVDTFGLFSDVRGNAAAFGFTNVTGQACGPFPPITATPSSQFCTAANIVAGGQGFLFADGVHPTPAAQAILANYVEGLIDGPAQYSLLPETALRAREAHVRTLAAGVQSGLVGTVGKVGAFVAVDRADFDTDAIQGLQQQRADGSTFTVGVAARVSETVVVGAAYGRTRYNAIFGNGMGGYRFNENTYSLFAGMQGERLYVNAAVSVGDSDYNDTRRDLRLGNVRRTFEARPEASNASAFVNVGYDFPIGRFKIGPTAVLAVQNVEVNTFDESPTGGAPITGALTIGTQKRRSEVWRLGARASVDIGNWTPWVRVTADKERRDDPRFVPATVRSLGAIGMVYEIEGYRPDNSFVTAYGGVRGRINDWVGVGVTYFKVFSRENITEDGITAAVSIRF